MSRAAALLAGSGPLAPRARALAALSAQALLVAASPGVLGPEPSLGLALAVIALWAWFASRPGRRAFLLEWLAGGLGVAAQCIWIVHVWWGALAFLVIVPGLYVALAGALLRRLAPRLSLALAAPLAWVALEILRQEAPSPLGYGWMRLGTHTAGWLELAASARVWGVYGLSAALAVSGGALADLARARALAPRLAALFAAALPFAIAWLVAVSSAPPEVVRGPRVLCVQPAFEQVRKQRPLSRQELFAESVGLTAEGLLAAERAGTPPDLVAWGETMLPLPLFAEGLDQALARGVESPEWTRDEISADLVRDGRAVERRWIAEDLLGAGPRQGLLPAGACFLSGVELYVEYEPGGGAPPEIRRTNAIVVWGPDGERLGAGGKLHLVPGAEELAVFERFAFVRRWSDEVAGYVPDLVPFERTEVVSIPFRGIDGVERVSRVGLSVCFDNIFDDPYTEPTRRGPLDFHLVCSNEAWYEGAFEMDQMVAFSRMIALQTGRSIVRATNSGITLAIGPDGRELGRLVEDGTDRMVSGTLLVEVPIPAAAAGPTPWAQHERWWTVGFVLAPLLALGIARLRERHGIRVEGA